MIDALLQQIKNAEPACYLNIEESEFRMWNFLAEDYPIFDTELLFRAACRPHFDYFFPQVDYLGVKDQALLLTVNDPLFKNQILEKQKIFLNPQAVLQALIDFFVRENIPVTLVTNKQLSGKINFKPKRTIVLEDFDLFGNVEPVWLQLKSQLSVQDKIFGLVLGLEKYLIAPRLKLFSNCPVVDLKPEFKESPTLTRQAKNLVKRILGRHY